MVVIGKNIRGVKLGSISHQACVSFKRRHIYSVGRSGS